MFYKILILKATELIELLGFCADTSDMNSKLNWKLHSHIMHCSIKKNLQYSRPQVLRSKEFYSR